jgi:sugar-specific transcriptional regulator TrmB
MGQEKILKTLLSLGLKQLDAEVYIFLAKRGPIKAKDAAKALKISKQRVYPIIKNLQGKGIVNATLEHPARFSAIPLEKMLDLFVKAKMEEAQRIQQNKDEILSDWHSIAIEETDETPARFTVIEGRNYIYSKMRQMIQETKNHLSIVTTIKGLARADQFGLFDAAYDHPLKSKIKLRFLTELSEQNVNAMKALLKRIPKGGFKFEGRTPDLGLKLFTQMVIRDEEEAIFFINPGTDNVTVERDNVCLWTNCKSIVNSFICVFEDLWRNSTDIEKKIAEIETGKPIPRTYVISDAETARKKYHEAMCSAKQEIIMITSSKGLVACWKGIHLVRERAERGVSVRILAPIISENMEAAQQLLKFCEVRHVAICYLGTTIIDGKHLFQLKTPPPDQEKPETTAYFENTFYSNDLEYVEKAERMLNDIWKNSSVPSAITLESVVRPPKATADSLFNGTMRRTIKKIQKLTLLEEEKPLGQLTEKDVLNKIINAKRCPVKNLSKDIITHYCSTGQAIIRSPDYLNMPNMLFHILRMDKNSSFGAEDAIIIMLWLETPKGYAYVPAAFVGDNPESIDFWKRFFAGLPNEQNVQLVKKDAIQVRVHGNTLFAGWTVQIPLIPPYSLPPSCILIEGYGDVKTLSWRAVNLSGHKTISAYNGFEAFVTFLHPSSKYSGPGTDGFFGRDVILTVYPP